MSKKKIVVVGAGGDIGMSITNHLEREFLVMRGTHGQVQVEDIESVRSFLGMCWAYQEPSMDGLVVCHGAPGCVKPTTELTDEEFQRVVEVDLTGTMRVCREAARYMLTQNTGNIVVLSSIHAFATYPERAAYAAAKAGVVGLVRAFGIEWANRGIFVNAVLPGQVQGTLRTQRVNNERMRSHYPRGNFVSSSSVSEAVRFLLTSTGIVGQTLVVDNGHLANAL